GDVRVALDLLGDHRVLELVDHPLGTHEIGELGDDDALAARRDVLDAGGRAGAERAAPARVRLAAPLEAYGLAAPGPGRPRAGTNRMSASRSASGCSMRCRAAATTSTRLWGGMFVAMPTAIPEAPLTSRFGSAAGSTSGWRIELS